MPELVSDFCSNLASTLIAPGLSLTMKEFGETSSVIGSFMITIYILGFAFGPLFLGPLSEMYGRYPAVVGSGWFFTLWLLGCAFAPNTPSLIAMRFLAGLGGAGGMTLAPAVVADLYPVESRGFWQSIIIMAQCLGPAGMFS
jgi:MFS family permease